MTIEQLQFVKINLFQILFYKLLMKRLFLFTLLLLSMFSYSQLGLGTINPSTTAALDLTSTTKGFLLPRMTHAQKTAIVSPEAGLQIWCLDCGTSGQLQVYNGTIWTNIVGAAASTSRPGAPASLLKPDAPTITGVTVVATQASVAFTAPANNGGSAITSYTVTASPEGFTKTGTTSPLVVTGLTAGTSYTFTVIATNAAGNSVASTASAAVTP